MPLTIPVEISYTSNASNVITDIEIYDESNARVFQEYHEGQNISQGTPANYSIQWTPGSSGLYTLKVGVFTAGWSSNTYWNDNVTTIAVGSQHQEPEDPGVGEHTTNIWWPTNGSSINGHQPFKAVTEGLSVEEYTMYWQVDGDRMNEMYNNYEGYPHKEFWVDLSGWNWREEGPYNVNFISVNNSGNTISESSIDIYVR